MRLTVAKLVEFLDECDGDDPVTVFATLADGSVLSVQEIAVGTIQGGPDGEGCDICIDWEPGAESVTWA